MDYKKELQKTTITLAHSQLTLRKPITIPATRAELESLDWDQLLIILTTSYIKNQITKDFLINLIDNHGGIKNDTAIRK